MRDICIVAVYKTTMSILDTSHPLRSTTVEARHNRQGFTLIELSIVLVIIGLLVGGTLVGVNLAKNARLRSVIADIESFRAATITFQAEYDCLPGDCPNATDFFGVYNGAGWCGPGAATTAATTANQTTCNGNGDGKVWYAIPGNTYYYSWEKSRFWQHLSAAGLVAGQYAGVANMDGGQASEVWESGKKGWNMPASKWKDAGYSVIHSSFIIATTGATYTATDNNKNKFVIGGETRCLSWTPCVFDIYAGIIHAGPVFSGKEAFQIDSKIDDGKPGTGKVTGMHFNGNGYGLYCGTNTTETLAEYRTFTVGAYGPDVASCPLFIDAGF